MARISDEEVSRFMNGYNPMERVVNVECSYSDDTASVIFVDGDGVKKIRRMGFRPFLWAKHSVCQRMCDGNRKEVSRKLREFGISVKLLRITNEKGETTERLENGYKFLFQAINKMSYQKFLSFFTQVGTPVYPKKSETTVDKTKEFMSVSPIEQFMIQTGIRLFKGYEAYDDLLRMLFDLETQGLNPKIHSIDQIGIRTNKGYERIISVEGEGDERKKSELNAIIEFVKIIKEIKPDIIAGHTSENFDWDFIITRCEVLGVSFAQITENILGHPIYKKKKDAVLKLGGEVEYYKPTVCWGFNIIDSLHAVRRAQAIDSSMESASLKYTTKYLKLNKPNRVYVPGNEITSTWNIQEEAFAFNDDNGDWYRVTDEKPLREGYVLKSGRYIVERYLLDDIWETDKIEDKLNEANFLVAKLLPTSFTRVCTMGTAAIWKLIMLAWSFENGLGIPAFGKNGKFTGGISRLLKIGVTPTKVVKLDYNSLYPSVILTWNLKNENDCDAIINTLLNYILTQREKYKEMKSVAGKKADALSDKLKECKDEKERERLQNEIQNYKREYTANDKKQLQVKVLGNSIFGAQGSPTGFNWGNLVTAEYTTCISRMLLRLMIWHFFKLGYEPIVGDSFTDDTPLFIKYDDTGYIDIKPICELIGKTETDALGREYDTSYKPFKVLCRSGWMRPKYIYRHKVEKPFYEVSEGNMSVTVTEDHSLFNDEKEKIKPTEIHDDTKLEYYSSELNHSQCDINKSKIIAIGKMLLNGTIDRIPIEILNGSKENIETFLKVIENIDLSTASKTLKAGIQFLNKRIKK